MSRKLTEIRNSLSEPDLTTPYFELSGFPPGITVDELHLYRRKKNSEYAISKDNLQLEKGAFQGIISEYTRRFKKYLNPTKSAQHVPSHNLLLDNGSYKRIITEYTRRYRDYSGSRKPDQTEDITPKNPSKVDDIFQKLGEKTSDFRDDHNLLKRSIQEDGQENVNSEDRFIKFLHSVRPKLTKRPTTLKLEGEMTTKTENMDKFIKYEPQTRPPLCKKFTTLHMEGNVNKMTENREKFVPYEIQMRPPIVRKMTNLHLEGEFEMDPEYRREFVEHKNVERSRMSWPVHNLKTNGAIGFTSNEFTSKEFERLHPAITFLRGGGYDMKPLAQSRPYSKSMESNLGENVTKTSLRGRTPSPSRRHAIKAEYSMQSPRRQSPKIEIIRSNSSQCLQGSQHLSPEYKNAYVDFYKDPKVSPKRRSRRELCHLKSEGDMEISPEYSRSYVDFPRSRPIIKKPTGCLSSSEGEMEHVTENNEKFVSYPNAEKTHGLKRESALKLEGTFECQPEYRKAYIDYLIREKVEKKTKPLDTFGNQQRRAYQLFTNENQASPIVSPKKKNSKRLQELDTKQLPRPKSPSVPSTPEKEHPKNKSIPRNRSLSQIESAIFGPKLSLPPRPPSRAISPRINSGTGTSSANNVCSQTTSLDEPTIRPTTKGQKFGESTRVENLACNYMTPIPNYDVGTSNHKKKWLKEDSVDSTAFVILDKEVNNNYSTSRSSYPDNVINKSRKWVPSWYSSPN